MARRKGEMRIGILGGGISGLALGSLLPNSEVIEKDAVPGGLCRSFQGGGYTFDIGGHILFSKNKEVLSFMLGALAGNVLERRRDTRIYYKGRFVKYPFENGLGDLPKEEALECLCDYVEAFYSKKPKARNFSEWLERRFGKAIFEKYLLPYNRKIWTIDPAKMATFWVEGRIPQPPLRDVIKAALGMESEGYTHQLNFHYPRTGGFQAITDALAARVGGRLLTGAGIVSIEKRGKAWAVRTSDGKVREYDRLVSTINLKLLARVMKLPAGIRKAIGSLRHNSIAIVMLGIGREGVIRHNWMYVPDPALLPNRLNFPANASPETVPAGCSSILAECTFDPDGPLARMSEAEIQERVIADVERMGLVRREEIGFAKTVKIEHAYVVYDLAYERNIRKVEAFFRKEGLVLLGRFAEFKYYNSDKCVERAIEVSRKLGK